MKILKPLVIITDCCKKIKSVIFTAFPNTQQQLCIYHVIKNVYGNVKKKYKKKANVYIEVNSDNEEFDDNDKPALSVAKLSTLIRLREEEEEEQIGPRSTA